MQAHDDDKSKQAILPPFPFSYPFMPSGSYGPPYPVAYPPPLPYQNFAPHPAIPSAPTAYSSFQQAASPLSSPHAAVRLNVSLGAFCDKYSISSADQEKLSFLEYRPGLPGVERLSEKVWREKGGFSDLGWESFLDAHRTFLRDIQHGKW
jgi:hypothetical protein